MRFSLLLLALATANGATVAFPPALRSTKYTNTPDCVSGYLDSPALVAKGVLVNRKSDPAISADPAVLIIVLPEADRPDYVIFWLRDGLLTHHTWFIELVLSPKDPQMRALVDGNVHALIRTHHVAGIAENSFSGGLEEAFFDLHIGEIKNPDYRIGTPAAGGSPFRALFLIEYAE